MIEIKFRLHDKGGAVIGFEIHKQNEFGCWQIYQTSLREDWNDGNENKLVREGYFIAAIHKVQYTGLKDKNGKEIYEGDIFKYQLLDVTGDNEPDTYTEYTEQVIFEDGQFAVEVMPLFAACTEGEVIGNIFENPELLK